MVEGRGAGGVEKGKNSKMSNPTPSVTLDADADEDADADDVDDVNDDCNDAAPPTPEGAARGACGKVVNAPRSQKVRQGASSSVSAKNVVDAGCSVKGLKGADYSCKKLKAAGCSAKDLVDAGCSVQNLKGAATIDAFRRRP